MGISYEKLNKNNEAINCFQKVIAIDPKHFKAYIMIAKIFDQTKQYDEAVNCYQKAQDIEPNYPMLNFMLNSVKEKKDY